MKQDTPSITRSQKIHQLNSIAASTLIDVLLSSYSVHLVSLEAVLHGDENTTRKSLAVNRIFGWWHNILNMALLGKGYQHRPDDHISGWFVKVPTADGVRYHAVLGFDRSVDDTKVTKLMSSRWKKIAPAGSFSSVRVTSKDEFERACSPEFWVRFVAFDYQGLGIFRE